MAELTPIIKNSFLNYAGAVLQSRALVDARDLTKPSARQIFYCMYTDKFIHSKPFQKTLKAIGASFRLYIHGDSSVEGIIMRAGQPFAMRYPLVEVEGSYGTLLAPGSWAAPRYTSSRLTALSEYLFKDIQKEVIDEWRDNYDNTEQYPSVLPSKGFFNLVNGSYGIAVGAAASIPQYNLKELNEALIKLLYNPEISFEDIYVMPDFATGAILLNAADVKESHRNGTGASCKLRSVVEFDKKERCFIVTEIPYMVYTETICRQLEEILQSENNPGIDRFNDLTGKTPFIKIYLNRAANPDKVLKYLYKNTSLQSHYGINFTMLDNGRFPKIFTWKELLQAHLDHEKVVYIRGFEFDLRKINARLHIIEALLKAIANIDEVVRTIKASSSSAAASLALQKLLSIDETQAKAILDIKLSRLAHLEVEKLEKERADLLKEKARIEDILGDENLLKKEIENGLREVASKFGDARRTQVLDICGEDDEPTEIRHLILNFTNQNNIFINETSSLYTQRKGGVGAKFKLDKGEYIVSSNTGDNTDTVLFFSNKGNFYPLKINELPVGEKINLSSFISIHPYESIKAETIISKANSKKFILFVTKNGTVKKSELSEYNLKRVGGTKAIELSSDDEIVDVLFVDNESIGILTAQGNLLLTQSNAINPTGRISKGRIGMKLDNGNYVVGAKAIIEKPREILTISKNGLTKRTLFSEFSYSGLNTKGKVAQKIVDGDEIIDFMPITNETEVVVVSSAAQIKIKVDEISLLSRGAQGSGAIKLKSGEKVISLQKI